MKSLILLASSTSAYQGMMNNMQPLNMNMNQNTGNYPQRNN